MEATATAAAPTRSGGSIRGLPPGPRMPRALQTAIWSRQAQWMLEQCRARFGDMFTLNIAYEGTWVMVSDPAASSRSSPATRAVFHAGEGNQILRPILGDNSVLVLDEKPHIGQRKLLLPPFHGERMQGYGEKMAEIAAREIESWPHRHPPQAAAADAGDHAGDHPRDRLRRPRRRADGPAAGGAARLPRPHHRPARCCCRWSSPAPTDPPHPPFRRRIDRVDELIHREIAERRPPRTSPSATTSSRCWSPPATRTAAR